MFKIKAGDDLPKLSIALEGRDGTPLDLTNKDTITINFIDKKDMSFLFSGTPAVLDAVNGKIEYQFSQTETANYSGRFLLFEVVVKFLTGEQITAPTNGYGELYIEKRLV